MNILLWVLQALAALLYGASGIMKLFLFEHIRHDVPSFDALPHKVWSALGLLELACALGLIVPAVLHWHAQLTVVAAALLALESLAFIGVHEKYRERLPLILSAVLGLCMAFISYGRMVLAPIL